MRAPLRRPAKTTQHDPAATQTSASCPPYSGSPLNTAQTSRTTDEKLAATPFAVHVIALNTRVISCGYALGRPLAQPPSSPASQARSSVGGPAISGDVPPPGRSGGKGTCRFSCDSSAIAMAKAEALRSGLVLRCSQLQSTADEAGALPPVRRLTGRSVWREPRRRRMAGPPASEMLSVLVRRYGLSMLSQVS